MDATTPVTESGSHADRGVVPEPDTARPRDGVGSLSTVEEITKAMKGEVGIIGRSKVMHSVGLGLGLALKAYFELNFSTVEPL